MNNVTRKEEIEEELQKLYKGREWRKEHYWAADMGITINGRYYSAKMMQREFDMAEARIEALEWVLGKGRRNDPR